MMDGQLANTLVTIVAAIVGSGGLFGGLQLVVNRSGRKAESARIVAETEKLREESRKLRTDREALIIDVQNEAYAAAKQTYNERYEALNDDYKKCRSGLDELRIVTEQLVEAVAAIMAGVLPINGHDVQVTVTGAEIDTVRAAVREARRHLS